MAQTSRIQQYHLDELHRIIQHAMGWYNYHLHQFINDETFFSEKTDNNFGLEDSLDESLYTLSDLLKKEKNWMKYEYDFGDSWMHKILLEKITRFDQELPLPICIKGKRACPPEDCGGTWGYYGLSDDFDSEKFDLEKVNQRLFTL